MIKRLLLIIISICIFQSFSNAQTFGNEWISYDQQYHRIKVWNNGIYRISWSTLLAAVPAIANVDPRNVQIFGRGEELPIHLEGEVDGQWNDGDFIEFYGRKNDGWFDRQFYENDNAQSNPYYSLFTDTAVYFLTWNNSLTNRRMAVETDQDFPAYTPAPYFIHQVLNQVNSDYYFGKTDANNSTEPNYASGEGWSGPVFSAPVQNQISSLPSANFVGTGPAAELKIVYKSISNAAWYNDHRYQLQLGNGAILDSTFEGHGSRVFNLSMASSSLGVATTPFKFSYLGINNSLNQLVTSNSVFSNYTWKYPHNFNLENQGTYKMLLPDNAANTKYLLNITNFNASASNVWFYDLTNGKRIQATNQAGVFKVIVPNGNGELKECFIANETQITSISATNIQQINYLAGQPGKFTPIRDLNNIKFLIVSHRSLSNEAEAYRNYRSGKFSSGIFYIDELCDQFAHGISQHPMAVSNLANTALSYWTEKPEYLLLLGKSISAHFNRQDAEHWSQNLVPTFGFPSSDVMLTAGLNGTFPEEPALATGRIAAKNGADVTAYLNKLQEYETAPPAMWMKQVLHFGGGQSQGEQQTYLNYLNTYKQTIDSTNFGGSVYTYQKTTSTPIEQTQSALIADYINNGVSLMTFFGHATGSGFDVSIDNPSAYSNQGKYPFLIGNSCYAGDIHQPPGFGFSQSEEFTLIPNRGTIGYISSVSLGIPGQLHTYTDSLYKFFGRKYYGEPMGMNMKRVTRAIYQNDPLRKAVISETTLHGDPGVVMNSQPSPDYSITQQSIFYNPSDVTTEVDSFAMNIVIENIGMAVNTPVIVEVTRTFPGTGLTTVYSKAIQGLFYRDTLTIRMPVTNIIKGGVGINSFVVKVDPLNSISEFNENNNVINSTLLIRSADVLPVWPYEFALVPNNTITLKATTGDPFAPARNYIFELDTTDLFNSPFKLTTTINQAGGVLNWSPTITLQDSGVYFWRVSPDSIAGGGYSWKESSFQHIQGKRGWSQDHFFQYKKNRFNQLIYDRTARKFDFVPTAKELTCYAYGFPWEIDELWGTSYKIDAEVWADAGCSLDPAVYIAVIDSVTLLPWLSPQNCWDQGNQFGQFNSNCACKSGNRMANFVFRSEGYPAELASMRDMINNVPNGHYILAYTWIYGNYQNWDPSVIQAFQDLGADSIQTLPNEAPYVFFVKKGHPETKVELIADSANANLVLSAPMFNSWVSGDFTSTLIGPGSGWDSLSYKVKGVDNVHDSIRVQVIGVRANGVEDVIVDALSPAVGEMDLNPAIGTTQYTYLKLNAFMRDDSLRSPVQLDRWQVTYDPVPECALNPLAGLYFFKDTLQQGEDLKLAIAIQNVSELPMDSMLVAYWIQDAERNIFPVTYSRQKPLAAGEILFDTLSVSTLPYLGLNSIWVEANPNFDQPEQFRFNNLGNISFFVTSDNVNPLLDVTFDNVHILNGDIISPKPEIVIQLADENPYLALDDTASFQLYLRLPGETNATQVYFDGNEVLQFIPGSTSANKAKIEYRPTFTIDGKYDFIVKAKDRSNNKSGSVEYKISFEVVNKSTITNILNYPNPFSTRTHFVFTLTGSVIPDEFRIQIMTITGKVVKDIRRDELGPIRIGRNVTEYYWDGTDEFGDPLGNGIYLYRVMTTIDKQDIERRETSADSYFERGFGKMYLMR